MKLGKIYDCRNKEEAKKLIGKKVLANDILFKLESQNKCCIYTLTEIKDSSDYPFVVDNMGLYQFIREIEEEDEPKRMTNRQLAEWCAKGNGQCRIKNNGPCSSVYCHSLLDDTKPVSGNVAIRPWGSDDWVEPTADIYETDCKSYCRTTLV